MTNARIAISRPALSSFDLQTWPLAWKVGAILLGTLVLTLSSHIKVPMVPVPMTMQSFAVALIGALYGWKLGGITIVAWLVEGAVGAPVFAGGAAGLPHLIGPTGGYLFAFPVAGALMGWLAERGWNGDRVGLALLAMLASNTVCLLLGASWLAVMIGPEKAVQLGVVPFVAGAVLKSCLGAVTLKILAQARKRTA